MIKGEAGVGGINDLIQWSEEDLSPCFLQMCYVIAASSILATLTSLEQ